MAAASNVDLTANLAGIVSPNPFWLASAPPTNTYGQVARAFDCGWGGAVWKTIGQPIVNVYSRYGGIDSGTQKLIGLNNIELITDRPIEDNLREMKLIKKRYPKHSLIASLMVESKREVWHEIVKRTHGETGCDGFELNFGCPHGMSERGMGAAVGQVPDYCQQIVEWVKEVSTIPVITKLTPNVADITYPAKAAKRAKTDAVSAINTINSLMGVDLDMMAPRPNVAGKGSHGGYCGPAVKPIALNFVSSIAADPELKGLPISGIGGISTWKDAAEFIAVGCANVQVCTAVMHYGFRIVEDMIDGLANWMAEKGYTRLTDFQGLAVPSIQKWENLDLNHFIRAHIDEDKCIGCELCFIACEDGAHQALALAPKNGKRLVEVKEDMCVGCNLCSLVCPVPGCITMRKVENGAPSVSWKQYSAGAGSLAPRPQHYTTIEE
ncbi:MAG: NAD-dependent dihydropyrimidine dehydrogenase subunit PreA [Deltaproteobacteria bacterium]|nr:NAD-dependent dihydropyrimidine dehydrogenase subunit PreA [Deltaproteobacteria bacterium]